LWVCLLVSVHRIIFSILLGLFLIHKNSFEKKQLRACAKVRIYSLTQN
jgi:hypothetical protein